MPAVARIDIAPNCSLTPRGGAVLFGVICGVSFAIAGVLALMGYWPVLPFAGLEMALLGWALKSSLDRRHHLQTILVTENEVAVKTCDGRAVTTAMFPRHWAQVKLRGGVSPLHPSRLTIESHGRRREIGSFLTEQERRSLAGRLQRLIGNVSEAPPLGDTGDF